jgi:hypothetical protein
MKTGTRKGFKYVAGSKSVVTETITFDDVEKERTTTPGASRKRGATRAAEAKAAKQRKVDSNEEVQKQNKGRKQPLNSNVKDRSPRRSPANQNKNGSSSSGVIDNESDKVKAHYPTIELPVNKITSILKKGGMKSHAEILDRIVVEVCSAEQSGLDAFFNANPGKGRETIHEILTTVLDQIPTSVTSTCDENAEFLPEFIPGEKNEVGVLTEVLDGLRTYTKRLETYEEDISRLANDYDIWLNGPPDTVCEAFRESYNNSKEATEGKLDVESSTSSYHEVLHEIQESCKSILSDTDAARHAEDTAGKIQDRLYKNYNRIRLQVGPSGVSLPSASTKDLMKGLGRM